MFALGESLGGLLSDGDVVGLVGDLGAGKTVFVQGLAHGLGVPSSVPVTSPTFTLIQEYDGGRLRLYHIDLYRLEDEGELLRIGLPDLYSERGVFAVEWADRFPLLLPRERIDVRIDNVSASSRNVSVTAYGAAETRLLEWKFSRAT